MQVDEFSKEISSVADMRLLDGCGVFVIWKWTWSSGPVSQTSDKVTTVNESILEDSDEEAECITHDVEEEIEEHPDEEKSTLVFKCIGATRETTYQDALERVRDLMECGEVVPVKIEPEPSNVWDPNAIAFKCMIDNSYVRIGYVIREVVTEVKDALDTNSIVNVKFSWVKYITHWSYSGHGFYAGISITRKGRWSKNATVKCSSS